MQQHVVQLQANGINQQKSAAEFKAIHIIALATALLQGCGVDAWEAMRYGKHTTKTSFASCHVAQTEGKKRFLLFLKANNSPRQQQRSDRTICWVEPLTAASLSRRRLVKRNEHQGYREGGKRSTTSAAVVHLNFTVGDAQPVAVMHGDEHLLEDAARLPLLNARPLVHQQRHRR